MLKKARSQAPAASEAFVRVLPLPGWRSMFAFAVSQTKVATTFVAALEPVLQIFAPDRNSFGPAVTSLLSSPITFHVMGTIVRAGAALAVRIPRGRIELASATTARIRGRALDVRFVLRSTRSSRLVVSP